MVVSYPPLSSVRYLRTPHGMGAAMHMPIGKLNLTCKSPDLVPKVDYLATEQTAVFLLYQLGLHDRQHRYQIVVFVAKIWAFKVRYLFLIPFLNIDH